MLEKALKDEIFHCVKVGTIIALLTLVNGLSVILYGFFT